MAGPERLFSPAVTTFDVDCGSGLMAEVVLDEDEKAELERRRAPARGEIDAQVRRRIALQRLRAAAMGDEVVRDLLTVLGLE